MAKSVGRKVTDEKFIRVYNDVERFHSNAAVGAELDIGERTVRKYAARIRKENPDAMIDRSESILTEVMPSPQNMTVIKFKERLKASQKLVGLLQKETISNQKLVDLIHGFEGMTFDKSPDWFEYLPKSGKTTGVPTLFLSDWHFDEVVNKAAMGGRNEFDRDIAERRIKHTFNTAMDLLLEHQANPNYQGIVVALGGDMLSGMIHEELAETNSTAVLNAAMSLCELIIPGLSEIHNKFGRVHIPCVAGNHGRIHKNKRMKDPMIQNFEWIIYHNIAQFFADADDVTVQIPEGSDCGWNIFHTRYLLTHGDQFTGGGGVGGIIVPIMRGYFKKLDAYKHRPFDIMMLGHFHQYIHTRQIIVNGSLKGYDEFAATYNFAPERPQQAMWITHPQKGVSIRMPVLCDEDDPNIEPVPPLTIWAD